MFCAPLAIFIETTFGQKIEYFMILLISSECSMNPIYSKLSLSMLGYLAEICYHEGASIEMGGECREAGDPRTVGFSNWISTAAADSLK